MGADPPTTGDWVLRSARTADLDRLMAWFPTQESVEIWGGPEFRFPFTRASFIDDIRWDSLESFSLVNGQDRLAAFGQLYRRKRRAHLSRLVVCPELRGQGLGKRLIELLLIEGRRRYGSNEYSLFVFRDNTPALQCYRSMGFVERDYPQDMPHAQVCYFLVRRDVDSA